MPSLPARSRRPSCRHGTSARSPRRSRRRIRRLPPRNRTSPRGAAHAVVVQRRTRNSTRDISDSRGAPTGVAFEGGPLEGPRVVVMPLRQEIVHLDRDALDLGCGAPGLRDDAPVLLVFGGTSARAGSTLHSPTRHAMSSPQAGGSLHATGEKYNPPDSDRGGYAGCRTSTASIWPTPSPMRSSRAGTATVSDVSALGISAIDVPVRRRQREHRMEPGAAVHAGARTSSPMPT